MKIISPRKTSRFLYDKFSAGVLSEGEKLLVVSHFNKADYCFLYLMQYEESKEWILWLGSDLFAEFHFDDVWLVFQKSERSAAKSVFEKMKIQIADLCRQTTETSFKRFINSIFEELETEFAGQETIAVEI